jgi:hypothetical protein
MIRTILNESAAFLEKHWLIFFSIGVLIGASVAFVEHLHAK